MDFLFSLPLLVLAVLLNVWLMGFALVSLWALRRWVLPRLQINTNAALFFGAAVMQSAMVLFVTISLDRPFRGAMAIPADSYQLVHDQLMKR